MTAPANLVLTNQFGEESENVVRGTVVPIVPDSKIIILSGATTPVNGGSGTGVNVADKGSVYIAKDTGLLYQQTGLISSPTWVACGSAGSGALLTGFSASAGTVAASDTIVQGFNKVVGNQAILQNATPTFQSEAISAAGALSTTKALSTVSNVTAGSYSATLAAPSSQDGQIKVIKAVATMTHTVTLACTNIAFSGAYTPTGTTTLTFTSVGDCAVLMAVGAKWIYLGGSAIAS